MHMVSIGIFEGAPLHDEHGALGVVALSYGEQLTIGLLADPGACADLDVFADGSFAELVAGAGRQRTNSSTTTEKSHLGVNGGSMS